MQPAATETKKWTRLRWQGLSKNDTTALKALGICCIVLHNYFHSFPGWRLENEFAFAPSKFEYFRSHLSADLYTNIGLLFAYLGHYGVQLFVFLSAYGLYISYRNKPLHYVAFVRNRIWKLWPAFFLAMLFLIVLTLITTRRFWHPDLYLGSLLRLSLLSNLVPGKSFDVVGPWWFYSMIVQFYLLFPLLRNWLDRYGLWPLAALSAASWLLQLLFTAKLNALGWTLNTLVIGHLPVFCLGLALAKYKSIPMSLWVITAAVILFCLGNVYMSAWVFSQISITVICLYLYGVLKKLVKPGGVLKKALFFIGDLSMYLFAVNGFLRHPFIQQAMRHAGVWWQAAVLLIFLIFVGCVALLLRFAERKLLKTFSKPHTPQGAVKAA